MSEQKKTQQPENELRERRRVRREVFPTGPSRTIPRLNGLSLRRCCGSPTAASIL